ncbi:MAG: hypothetical protein L6Q84_09205 [Polyangiaceae bacterium]|nr:hypothetical protein [Polyangiaceae bacterium]
MAHAEKPGSQPPPEQQARSLADLAAEQDVKPVQQLETVSALWPVDDDPDALDAFLAKHRSSRREASAAQRQAK